MTTHVLRRLCVGAALTASAAASCTLRDLSYLQSGLGGSSESSTTTSTDISSSSATTGTTTAATTSVGSSSSGAGGQGSIEPDPVLPVMSCGGGSPCGDPAVIVDFESNDGQACPTSGRSGYALIFNDGTGKQWPLATGNPSTACSPLAACRGQSAVAFHTKGAGFTSWGAGVTIIFAAHGWDASAYSGLLFWAKSSTLSTVRIGVSSAETQDVSYGGSCVPQGGKQCGDHFSTQRSITEGWKAYPVSFSELKQVGWGVAAPTPTIDTKALIEVQFVFPQGADFDFWLDDLAFTQ